MKNLGNLTEIVQKEIIKNYHIWPSNLAALDLLPDTNIQTVITESTSDMSAKISILEKRCKTLKSDERNEFLKTYARPIINKEKARLSSGP